MGFRKNRCTPESCDATMDHMRKASVRDMRYRFREVEHLLREAKEIEIPKRKRIIARLVPDKPAVAQARPDFLRPLKEIYGGKPLRFTCAELASLARGPHS